MQNEDPDIVNRSVNLLYLPFISDLDEGLGECHEAGLDVYLFEGHRTPWRQDWLFRSGRTRPGPIVTNAVAWNSWHQFGCAGDLAFSTDGGQHQWSWEGDWTAVGNILVKRGFEWFGDKDHVKFHEKPHFQKTYGLSIFQAKQLYDSGGFPMVWKYFDQQQLPGGNNA